MFGMVVYDGREVNCDAFVLVLALIDGVFAVLNFAFIR